MNRKLRRALLGPTLWALGLGSFLAVALADVWDPGDNGNTTRNELVHGSVRRHSLGPGGSGDPLGRDHDHFAIGQQPFTSYEVVVEEASPDLVDHLVVERFRFNFGLQQTAVATHLGPSLSLRWENTLNSSINDTTIRVGADIACNGCSSNLSLYMIRSFETTYSIPRFNNSASQATIVMIQNTAAYPVGVTLHFMAGNGAVLGSQHYQLQAKQLLVTNTANLAVAQNASGSIVITHDGRYGDLSGKAVGLEPSTGYTFDTPMTLKPL